MGIGIRPNLQSRFNIFSNFFYSFNSKIKIIYRFEKKIIIFLIFILRNHIKKFKIIKKTLKNLKF